MKRNLYNLLIIFILFLFLISILIFSSNVLDTVIMGIKIWKENIFSSLFPFFVVTDLLISYGFVDLIGEIFKKLTNKILYLPGEASFVIIASIFSGFPSSAKFIKGLLDEKKISIENAEYLLSFCHFPNPLFVMGVISRSILNNKTLGTIILASIFLGNIIIALSIRKNKTINTSKTNIKNVLKKISQKNKSNNFIKVLTESIIKTINTLLLLLGIIITFLIITVIVQNILNLNKFNTTIISGILEMTSGINNTSYLDIPLVLKASLITFFISFGGISIHLQVMSILVDDNIRYKYYLLSRLVHALISSSITLLISNFFIT